MVDVHHCRGKEASGRVNNIVSGGHSFLLLDASFVRGVAGTFPRS